MKSTVLIASGNKGKIEEIKKLFNSISDKYEIVSLKDLNIQADCPETGDTFKDNAIEKALFYSSMSGTDYVIADDSGLAVDILNGLPGVHSARYAGDGATDQDNIDKLLDALKGNFPANARFHSVIALVSEDSVIETFTGTVEGEIIENQKGDGGFGYDPVFYYKAEDQTFAEIGSEVKNRISHRAVAFKKLEEFLKKREF